MKIRVGRCVLTLGLVCSLIFGTNNTLVTMAESMENNALQGQSPYEEIMNEYYCARIDMLQSGIETRMLDNKLDVLKDARNQALLDAGYAVYVVNSSNFESIEAELETDLGEIGLDNGGDYLIVVGNDMQETGINSVGSSFSYTYNGKTYTMRTLRVTADSDEATSGYAQASDVDILQSSSTTVITNVLNTAISAYISTVSASLGTIASICGLDISNFYPNKSATMRLNAASNWTRDYTQVYSSYDNAWAYGSCVEYVYCLAFMSGTYYEATTNRMTPVPTKATNGYLYSTQYNNDTWKRQQAAIAFSSGSPCIYNSTGSVQYKYGSSVKITHPENF